jgi:hypothetical protein
MQRKAVLLGLTSIARHKVLILSVFELAPIFGRDWIDRKFDKYDNDTYIPIYTSEHVNCMQQQ